ncbi:MAG: DUF4230 domain-containing protein [Bryobacteraceae bacterium]
MIIRRGYLIAAIILIAIGSIWLARRNKRPLLDGPAIVTEIQKISELASVKYTVQKVIGVEEQKIPFGMESLLLVVQGRVVGGVDLSHLKENDIVRRDDQVYVNLPPARILHVYLDEKQTKVWDRKVTWWTPWVPFSPSLETRARQQALKSIQDTASEMGILREADRNAQQTITTLLKVAGFSDVRFRAPS